MAQKRLENAKLNCLSHSENYTKFYGAKIEKWKFTGTVRRRLRVPREIGLGATWLVHAARSCPRSQIRLVRRIRQLQKPSLRLQRAAAGGLLLRPPRAPPRCEQTIFHHPADTIFLSARIITSGVN